MREDRLYERSTYEAILEVSYCCEFHSLNARFYRRVKILITWLTLIGGATAFASAMQPNGKVAAVAAFIIAALSFFDVVVGLSEKAAAHEQMRRRYAELERDTAKLTLDEIAEKRLTLGVDDIGGIAALQMVAVNRVVRSAGRYSYLEPLTIWQRIISIMA